MRHIIIILSILIPQLTIAQDSTRLRLAQTIYGEISPKSIVYSGDKYFFAQNMMYKHKITVYDRSYELVKTISDEVDLSYCGHENYSGIFQGSPVEATFSHGGRYMWVSNYQMYGDGFENPGTDGCRISDSYDSSFVYRIDTRSFDIDAAIKVGAIPKYLATTPNNKYILVSNWCSGDLSIIDALWNTEIKRIKLGKYPRGIAVDKNSEFAYVAIMGETRIAVVDLKSFQVSWIENVGKKPRHLCIDSKSEYLYATINSENKIQKIDLLSKEVVDSSPTQRTPRSMTISDDDQSLFVVNYNSNTMSHIRTETMNIVQTVATDRHPIGITFDPATKDVWVACYSGSIKVFNQVTIESQPEVAIEETEETTTAWDDIPTETQDFENDEQTVTTSEAPTGRYHVIVGAFAEQSNVDKMLEKCRSAGYSPYVVNPGARVQKVSCHNYASSAAASAELRDIQNSVEQGAWVMKK